MKLANYIEQIKKGIDKKLKWKEIKGIRYVYDIGGHKYIAEVDLDIERPQKTRFYACRCCGHIQRDNDKPCEKCGW